MGHVNRIRARWKDFQLQLRPRLGDSAFKFFQRSPDESAQPALRQTFRQRINWRDAVDVDETFLAALDDFIEYKHIALRPGLMT